MTERCRKALIQSKQLYGSVSTGREPDSLAELRKQPDKNQVRRIWYDIFPDNFVSVQSSGPPCSLLRTRSFPIDCTSSLNLRSCATSDGLLPRSRFLLVNALNAAVSASA